MGAPRHLDPSTPAGDPSTPCGADTQGAIGYQIVQTLGNELRRRSRDKKIVAVVTKTVVDKDDPGFRDPSKPIGPFFAEESAKRHQESGLSTADRRKTMAGIRGLPNDPLIPSSINGITA
jgi:carbamate kinase